MSTDRSRLVSSIRRIVLQDPEIRDLIDEFRNRGGFGSTSATIEGAEDARRICCDGSVSGNTNPGSDTKDPNEDSQEGLDGDDPADIGSGRLTGITDCATGEDICLEGLDWTPPGGWEDPNTAPVDPGWEDGTYICRGSANDCDGYFYSPQLMCDSFEPGLIPDDRGPDVNGDTQYTCIRPDTLASVGNGRRRDCGAGDTDEVCEDPDPPIANHWSWDGCINLAFKGGDLVGSKYDPENIYLADSLYNKPIDEIELCDEFGNSFFIRSSASGGWKTLNANQEDGYLYDSQGKKIAHIDGNEYSDPDI